ncbi:hypothetical protein J2Y45_003222 [Dyadobacter sp. BE34]|uniref:Uncharacterized protein n=1 Tax=Dyadobacter fermentans TaxID=94254 RepID=A0ABU1QZ71_9BACT|nr:MULTISPECIES: hypothetical protein [Dyadobacter]MDR6806030.1 hypothetical protein [Dyadobacter fermentans]MDR7043771.1 hypothetical protein [Dyadobacter sp. BE242]MDR7198082.1 hypothetical protein [Dyadobacter sp. BE34]MDR7216045.1 hypothetical protein [Dyadobacter sp. BE31]MDR7264429.1 hypothetical protein [Dyadobacter sp. BE32]
MDTIDGQGGTLPQQIYRELIMDSLCANARKDPEKTITRIINYFAETIDTRLDGIFDGCRIFHIQHGDKDVLRIAEPEDVSVISTVLFISEIFNCWTFNYMTNVQRIKNL